MTPQRILCVDDDEALRLQTTLALKSAGFHVYEAVDIREAKEILGTQKMDFALLDILLPDGHGRDLAEVCIRLRIPFAYLTVLDRVSARREVGDDTIILDKTDCIRMDIVTKIHDAMKGVKRRKRQWTVQSI